MSEAFDPEKVERFIAVDVDGVDGSRGWSCGAGPEGEDFAEMVRGADFDKLLARRNLAIDYAVKYGGIDGDHHKAWVIDQMVRALAGDQYDLVVAAAKAGADGSNTFEWNEGIAP